MSTYTVMSGDTPAMIAQRMTGNPARLTELVLANPQKTRQAIGGVVTFQSLLPGELLSVPKHWGVGASCFGKTAASPMQPWLGVAGALHAPKKSVGVGALSDDVSSEQQDLAQATQDLTTGDNTADDGDAIQAYYDAAMGASGVAASAAETAASAASAGADLTLQQNAATNAGDAKFWLSQIVPGTTTRADAQTAAQNAVSDAKNAVAAAALAVSQTGQSVTPTPSGPSGPPYWGSQAQLAVYQQGLVTWAKNTNSTGLVSPPWGQGPVDTAGQPPGPRTKTMTTAFQTWFNANKGGALSVDGKPGAKTQAAMQAYLNPSVTPPGPGPNPNPNPNPNPSPTPSAASSDAWMYWLGGAAVLLGGGALWYYKAGGKAHVDAAKQSAMAGTSQLATKVRHHAGRLAPRAAHHHPRRLHA